MGSSGSNGKPLHECTSSELINELCLRGIIGEHDNVTPLCLCSIDEVAAEIQSRGTSVIGVVIEDADGETPYLYAKNMDQHTNINDLIADLCEFTLEYEEQRKDLMNEYDPDDDDEEEDRY